MAEQEYQVVPIGIRYLCDKCQDGYMVSLGKLNFRSETCGIRHVCNSCGHQQYLNEKYPTVRFRAIDNAGE